MSAFIPEFEVLPPPTTLSGWVRAAVEDAQRLAATPDFMLDMSCWNEVTDLIPEGRTTPDSGPRKLVCRVCLAGAALVGRGIQEPNDQTHNCYVDYQGLRVNMELLLDSIRTGGVLYALSLWDPRARVTDELMSLGRQIYDACNTPQEVASLAPWRLYLELVDELERMGL